MISKGFEVVSEVFNTLMQQKVQSAAQVAVFHHGQLVVDLFGSTPDSMVVNSETPFLTFSVSKSFTCMAVMRLIEEGRVELDAPIARYWPEFACGGKETATIRHALLHQAGIPAPHLNRQVFLWPSWTQVTRALAKEKAQFPPGTQTAYHLVNFGFILGEVVRRVTGQPIDLFLQHTFFDPMGLQHTWMQIPANALRSSPPLLAISPSMRTNTRIFNLPIIRRALIPAACLHSNARGLATFFQMLLNGGEFMGKRFLQSETIAMATHSHYDGFDSYLKENMNWGFGMIIGGGSHSDPDPHKWVMGYGSSSATFAGLGMGTCMVWADRRTSLVTAFTSNGMLNDPEVGQRWARISNAVWDCVSE